MHPLRATRLHALSGFQSIEHLLDRICGSRLNPLRQLGALGFLLFWMLAISGTLIALVAAFFCWQIVGFVRQARRRAGARLAQPQVM